MYEGICQQLYGTFVGFCSSQEQIVCFTIFYIKHLLNLTSIRNKSHYVKYFFNCIITHLFSFKKIRTSFLYFCNFSCCPNTNFWGLIVTCTLFTINYFIYTKTKKVEKTALSRLKVIAIFFYFDKKTVLIRLKTKAILL